MKRRCKLFFAMCIAVSVMLYPLIGYANPSGGTVVSGAATTQVTDTNLAITQQTNKLIMNWDQFDIQTGEAVQFIQPSSQSIVLNRIMSSGQKTFIDGQLSANGRVFVVNPNGTVFGNTARVNVGGLVVSTANIANDAFMNAGDGDILPFDIAGQVDGSIVNFGGITIADRGLAAFVAPHVAQHGIIQGRLSEISLAAADTFSMQEKDQALTLDIYGTGLFELAVEDELAARMLRVEQSGDITAAGSRVFLAAADAEHAVNSIVNMTGHIEAASMVERNGEIIIAARGGKVQMSGSLDVSGVGTGGVLHMNGTKISMDIAPVGESVLSLQGNDNGTEWALTASQDVLLEDAGSFGLIADLQSVNEGIAVHAVSNTGGFDMQGHSLTTNNGNVAFSLKETLSFEKAQLKTNGGHVNVTARRIALLDDSFIETLGGDVQLHSVEAGATTNAIQIVDSVIGTAGGKLVIEADAGKLDLRHSTFNTTGGQVVGHVDIDGSGAFQFMESDTNTVMSGDFGGDIMIKAHERRRAISGEGNCMRAGGDGACVKYADPVIAPPAAEVVVIPVLLEVEKPVLAAEPVIAPPAVFVAALDVAEEEEVDSVAFLSKVNLVAGLSETCSEGASFGGGCGLTR